MEANITLEEDEILIHNNFSNHTSTLLFMVSYLSKHFYIINGKFAVLDICINILKTFYGLFSYYFRSFYIKLYFYLLLFLCTKYGHNCPCFIILDNCIYFFVYRI